MTGFSYVLNALEAQGEEFSPDTGTQEGLLKFGVGYIEHGVLLYIQVEMSTQQRDKEIFRSRFGSNHTI